MNGWSRFGQRAKARGLALWSSLTSSGRSNRPVHPAGGAGVAGLPDYDEYTLTPGQRWAALLTGGSLMGGIAFVFFQHPLAVVLFATAGLRYPVYRRKALRDKRKAQLKLQFRQLLTSLSSALGAGRSVESAFPEALSDLKLLYPDAETMIIRELETIVRRMQNGETIEVCLHDFSRRAHLDEIEQFADVFIVCKRTGGSLVQVIRRTATLLSDQLSVEQDIQVQLAQKRFEARVLSAAPVCLVALMLWSAPDYMAPLYSGGGVLVMAAALAMLIGCQALIQKMMNIKV